MFIDKAMHCHSACFSLVIERPSVVYWGGLVKGKLPGSLFLGRKKSLEARTNYFVSILTFRILNYRSEDVCMCSFRAGFQEFCAQRRASFQTGVVKQCQADLQ